MVKYLIKRKNTFWYRRKIKQVGEIIFSLKTKNYDTAIVRHSYITYKINFLMAQRRFHLMTVQEIREIINKYKTYMLTEEYNDFEDIRDQELSIEKDGQIYGGHTPEALEHAINKYRVIHASNDIQQVKEEAEKILNRSNLKNDFLKLSTDKEKEIFYWELLKAEWELLYKAFNEQKSIVQTVPEDLSTKKYDNKQKFQELFQLLKESQAKEFQESGMTILELKDAYILEKNEAQQWSNKNLRDIHYVLNNLASYYDNCNIRQLTRKHFVEFRDKVLKFLPKSTQRKEYYYKSTKEIISIVKKKKYETISITGINKHLRRIHQVFNWAENSGYIEKNYTKDLKLREKNKSKKQKTAKLPYSEDELVQLFEKSPWFNEKVNTTLKQNPENIFIPLLALFTGAKPMELGLLHISAITEKNGIVGIDFNQMIKTVDSERFIPLANALIDIGFLKYVNNLKKKRIKQLFPNVKKYNSGGINFTNVFTTYNRKYITDDPKKSFYSLRHLVNQKFKENKVPSYIINNILGHSNTYGNKDEEVYGDRSMSIKILQDTINECLVYDLNFSVVKSMVLKIYS